MRMPLVVVEHTQDTVGLEESISKCALAADKFGLLLKGSNGRTGFKAIS